MHDGSRVSPAPPRRRVVQRQRRHRRHGEAHVGGAGYDCLAGGHFADLKKGLVDFGLYLDRQDPEVVIIDVSPPYAENWKFFVTLRDNPGMAGRGLVLTTTNKERLDEAVGRDSEALELVGKPYDLDRIKTAITAALDARAPYPALNPSRDPGLLTVLAAGRRCGLRYSTQGVGRHERCQCLPIRRGGPECGNRRITLTLVSYESLYLRYYLA